MQLAALVEGQRIGLYEAGDEGVSHHQRIGRRGEGDELEDVERAAGIPAREVQQGGRLTELDAARA